MVVFPKTESYSDVVEYFKELLFYNKPIEKPKIKYLKKHSSIS